jgi:hypothetical protein
MTRGRARGTISKDNAVGWLKTVPSIKDEDWLKKQTLFDLLAAVRGPRT